MSHAITNQAGILAETGRQDQAIVLYKKAARLAGELQSRATLAHNLRNQAILLAEQGKVRPALALADSAKKLAEQSVNQKLLHEALCTRSFIATQMSSTTHLQQASPISNVAVMILDMPMLYFRDPEIHSAWGSVATKIAPTKAPKTYLELKFEALPTDCAVALVAAGQNFFGLTCFVGAKGILRS